MGDLDLEARLEGDVEDVSAKVGRSRDKVEVLLLTRGEQ